MGLGVDSSWKEVALSCDLIANADVVRVTRLDQCGTPVPGENAYVSECFASLSMNPNIDEQDDIIYRAANGSLCGVKRGCPTLLGYDLEFNFFQVSPELTDVLTGSPVVLDFAGEPVGNDSCDILCDNGFAIELWSELVSAVCSTTGEQRYLYTLIPWVTNAYISDLEIGSEQVTFQLVGSSRAGGGWDVGPYDVVAADAINTPGPMLTPLGPTCHRRMQITTIAPPVPTCDYQVVPAPAP
jgi:hypothetical protein